MNSLEYDYKNTVKCVQKPSMCNEKSQNIVIMCYSHLLDGLNKHANGHESEP